MTDDVHVEGQSQAQFTPTPQSIDVQADKTVTMSQSRLNEIIGETRIKAREEGKERALREATSSTGGIDHVPRSEIERLIEERTQHALQKTLQEQQKLHEDNMQHEYGRKLAYEFNQKLELGKKDMPDYDETIGKVDFRSIPEIVVLANEVDNTIDVIKEISARPEKIAHILSLASRSEPLARQAMRNLSESIKTNKAASTARTPNEPIKHIDPSNNAAVDDGNMSVSDYQKIFKG